MGIVSYIYYTIYIQDSYGNTISDCAIEAKYTSYGTDCDLYLDSDGNTTMVDTRSNGGLIITYCNEGDKSTLENSGAYIEVDTIYPITIVGGNVEYTSIESNVDNNERKIIFTIKNGYTVTVKSSNNGYITIGEDSDDITEKKKLEVTSGEVYVKAYPNNGYELDVINVSGDADVDYGIGEADALIANISSDLIITPVFKSNSSYKIITYPDCGTITLSKTSASSGEKVYVTCIPDRNYKFKSWYATGTGVTAYGTASASNGYIIVGTSDVTVTGVFEDVWDDVGQGWFKLNESVCYYDISYKEISFPEGYTGKIELKSATGSDYAGIFLSEVDVEQWGENYTLSDWKDYFYQKKYASNGTDSSIVSVEINDIQPGTYYVTYRREPDDGDYNDNSGWVAYRFTEQPAEADVWVNDTNGYRIAAGWGNSHAIMLTETITIPNGKTGTVYLESNLVDAGDKDYDGVFLSKTKLTENWVGTLSSHSSYFYSSTSYSSGEDATISDIQPGTYYVTYRRDATSAHENQYVRYKLVTSSITYKVTFDATEGGKLKDSYTISNTFSWGNDIGKSKSIQNISFNSYSGYIGLAEKTGSTFGGWCDSDSVPVYDETGKYCVSKYINSSGSWIYPNNVTLYAYWGTLKYYINYYDGDDYLGQLICEYGKTYELASTYTKDGHIFSNWIDEDGKTYAGGEKVSNLVSVRYGIFKLYAQWTYEDSYDKSREKKLIDDYNKMSANSIKSSIENGQVSYCKDSNSNAYKINILDPDSVNTYDVLSVSPVIGGSNNVISSVDVTIKQDSNDLSLKIINRYSGYYNPIFKDILFYNDIDDKPFSNTSFDDDYEDNYGKFGVINNMWFHKVNNEKTNILSTEEAKYPLTGQYALDFKDYNIFSTNWDKGYYTKQLDITHSESCDNMESMKEGLCMFGSKYLNVPEKIYLEGFNDGGEWNDDYITDSEGCSGEVMYKEINDNSVDFYFFLHKRLLRYFYEKLKDEFEKYIDKEHSYGLEGLDDDIKEYVEKNILKLYELKRITMYVKRTKMGTHNSRIENEYGSYLDKSVDNLKSEGFTVINTLTLSKRSTDDFDRQITYNLRNGEKEDFGFQVMIKKI